MKEYKVFSLEEVLDKVRLPMEAWTRVRNFPKEEYKAAICGELTWPAGFLEHLKGKSLEEQMGCYRIVEEVCHSRTAYGEVTNENKKQFGYALEDYPGLTGLIVEDGILIGVCMDCFACYDRWGTPAFPYQNICTYYASDNNGAGSKDREDYAHLCCVKID